MSKAKVDRSSVRTSMAPTLGDELAGALGGEIRRCARRAAEQAELLESIGAHAFEFTCEIFPDCSGTDLSRRAHAIRGVVAHALGVITELRGVAGSLEALATLRHAEAAAGASEDVVQPTGPVRFGTRRS